MPDIFGQSYSRRELSRRVGRLDQVAGVRLVTLGDGGGRGVRLLEFRTGTGFAFDVLVDRAFDIGRCELRGVPLAWLSGVGVEGPWFAEPEGLGFFRTFGGGLLVTCGIEHSLFMAEDAATQYHYPPKQTETFGLHGRISNRPARLVGYGERWDGDECTLYAEGETQVATVFGEQLVLRRRIEARLGESRLHVHDVVENTGHDLTPHMLLYHVNAGFPVVDEGSEILVAATGVAARGNHPVEGYRRLAAPEAGWVEQVFEHELGGEPEGTVPAGVVNRRLGVGALPGLRPHPAPPPLRLAHPRRGDVRRRDRAVHEPHRRPPRRAGARRADRARCRREPQLRPRARGARRRRRDRPLRRTRRARRRLGVGQLGSPGGRTRSSAPARRRSRTTAPRCSRL